MANRYSYEFKTFKSGKRKGQTYVNIRSVKTGKTIRTVSSKVKVKSAHRSAKQQVYRRDEKEIDDMIRQYTKEYGGNYTANKKRYKKALPGEREKEAERMKKGLKEGKLMRGRSDKNIKKDIVYKEVQKKSGYVTTWRLYWVIQEDKYSSSYIRWDSGSMHGDHYNEAIDKVNDVSLPIIDDHNSRSDFSILSGKGSGACVRLIHRESQVTVKAYGLGAGCERIQGGGLGIYDRPERY